MDKLREGAFSGLGSFVEADQPKTGGRRRILLLVALLAALGGAAWWTYRLPRRFRHPKAISRACVRHQLSEQYRERQTVKQRSRTRMGLRRPMLARRKFRRRKTRFRKARRRKHLPATTL